MRARRAQSYDDRKPEDGVGRASDLDGSPSTSIYPVTGPIVAITRIQFRRPWDTLAALKAFRRLYKGASAAPGFIRGSVSLAGPTVVINLSLWQNVRDMLLWSGRSEHVDAVHWTSGRISEAWSAYWTLVYQSRSANTWSGKVLLAREVRALAMEPNPPTVGTEV